MTFGFALPVNLCSPHPSDNSAVATEIMRMYRQCFSLSCTSSMMRSGATITASLTRGQGLRETCEVDTKAADVK